MSIAGVEHAKAAFLAACRLDVAVRKPGNVSVASPGHGMRAGQFIASAAAAAGPLFEPGAPVGRRIEQAVQASWSQAGCNTNLGIVLLCAPIAVAVERRGAGGLADAIGRPSPNSRWTTRMRPIARSCAPIRGASVPRRRRTCTPRRA
jgi:triphosphoribosyl-dephospho-CoA synthase